MNKRWQRYLLYFLAFYTLISALLLGIIGGRLISRTAYISNAVTLINQKPSLPSRVLDVNNNLITEFGSEDRSLISLTDMPRSMTYALLVREDATFFKHQGFSISGTGRALVFVLLNKFFPSIPTAGGGSTLTQQLAGRLWSDRRDISYKRKLVELWWAVQFEHNLSKEQILENYINLQYFGDRNYGVETASQFFFNHPARFNSVAESVVLMIQLSRPNGDYSPLRNPENVVWRQKLVLDDIVKSGYMSQQEVDQAFNNYWSSIDPTRQATKATTKLDLAPFFSEYVRKRLEEQVYGSSDIYSDGFTIYTTLDLGKQKLAESIVEQEMQRVDKLYESSSGNIFTVFEREELPFLRQLKYLFNIDNLDLQSGQQQRQARQTFQQELAPTLESLSIVFGLNNMEPLLKLSTQEMQAFHSQNLPEVAFISINNENAYIESMVGGREYKANQANQFNRAVDAELLPGSAIKPLFYAAAIKDRVMSPATLLSDLPYRFQNPDGSYYIPENYSTKFRGQITARNALALSLNIPAIHVLELVGFDKGIELASALLGYHDPYTVSRLFPRFYPLALGISPVSPYRLAQAYASFVNQGIVREPLAIRYVEDRNGNIILNPEEDSYNVALNPNYQLLSPEEAYIMLNMLSETVRSGTFYGVKRDYAGTWRQPLAAKSGTSQNWADGWGVLLSPYSTAIAWIGFDQRGNSLGERLYGARAAGPIVMRYMLETHRNRAIKPFYPPEGGYTSRTIERSSGKLWQQGCTASMQEYFLPGTEPSEFCTPPHEQSSNLLQPQSVDESGILDDLLNTFDNPELGAEIRRSLDN